MDNRKIDVLVASKVMGWIKIEKSDFTGFDFVGKRPLIDEAYSRDNFLIPHYSTDISAAWQVIQKLQADGWHYEVGDMHTGRSHFVKFGRGKYDPYDNFFEEEHSETASTPWLAICLAALQAVGIEVEEEL